MSEGTRPVLVVIRLMAVGAVQLDVVWLVGLWVVGIDRRRLLKLKCKQSLSCTAGNGNGSKDARAQRHKNTWPFSDPNARKPPADRPDTRDGPTLP